MGAGVAGGGIEVGLVWRKGSRIGCSSPRAMQVVALLPTLKPLKPVIPGGETALLLR